MKGLTITREELEEIKRLQLKHHWKWPAAFSANPRGDIWPYVTRGYTDEGLREQVRHVSKIIDAIADEYLNARPTGGRFFIDDTGAFYTPQGESEVQFLAFRFVNPK